MTLLPKKRQTITLMVLALLFFYIPTYAQTVADFRLDKVSDNVFQVSMIPNQTYAPNTNRVNSMQVVVRVGTGGFAIHNLTNLINTGQPNEVEFASASRNNTPIENPLYDYISFSLQTTGTTDIPFVAGEVVPLFTFENGGACSTENVSLITAADPFYPPNTINANSEHQLTVLGFGGPDAPVGIDGTGVVADCTTNCVAEYEIEKLTNGSFRVNLTPMVTYNGTDNTISNLQITVKVRTGGFEVGNLINLINTGLTSEVTFGQTSRYNTPTENPDYDYVSFNLDNIATSDIPFQVGQKVELFTFNNVGLCTEDTVRLIDRTDPFYPPNSGNLNADQQITILGYGSADAPVCVTGSGAADCTQECYLGCNDNVQVSLGINCMAEVVPEMIATALDLTCPNGPKGIEILENGVVIPTNPFINESHIGRTFQVRVIDSVTTNSCWGSIIVKDKTPPIIECENDTLGCGIQDYSPNNPILGYPIVTDNCSDTIANLTYTDNIIRTTCGTGFSGRIERTWEAIDSAGMVGTCVQNIYFEKQSLVDVIFPANRNSIDGPIVDCIDGGTDPSNTGSPTLNGNALYPNFIGFCEIDAGFRDDSISFCVGNKRIVRTWTVVDACTGESRTQPQIIMVQDTTAPVFTTCLDTIRGTVDAGICSGTVIFPTTSAIDACSGASITIETPFGNINTNGGSLSWVPIGYHQISYIATDSCNNESRCNVVLHVADRTAPVATCSFVNDVSLRPNGTVDVFANVFDDNSRDGCSGNQLTLAVQRVGDTLDFADYVTFYCTDAGDTVDVNLLVTDVSGNTDQCVARIVITNDTPPQMVCPGNQTIQCTDDYSDLSIFGIPTIIDDCGGATNYIEEDSFAINTCGVGNIYRNFIINNGGNMVSCQQVISVGNSSVFDGNTIVWPADYATFACNNASLDPDSLPAGFNVPRYDSVGNLCSRILRYHNDAIFDDVINPEGCYTILRTWSIIDWCVFNPNDTLAGGYWSDIQQIELVNGTPPEFTNCPADVSMDIEVDITDNSCSAQVPLLLTATDDCTPDNQLTYSYSIDIDSDGSTDFTGTSNDASGFYQAGTHRALFTVQDDCGNLASCNFQFTIRDRTLPIAICNTDTFSVENSGDEIFASILPRQLALNSSDNCTSFDDLSIIATPKNYNCTEVDSLVEVLITITDEAGNSSNCTANVFIDDANDQCPMNRTAVNISGIVVNEKGAKVDQVEVTINHPDVIPSMTGKDGEFMLTDVPVGNDYTLIPKRDFDILNGVSTFDLVLISRHILDIENIQSPYRLIAADVNQSGGITSFDIVLLRKLILRLSDSFPNNASWRFIRGGFNFEDPTQPLNNYFPEIYNINNLPGVDMRTEGFVAVKIGDINGSASTQTSFVEGESRMVTSQLDLKTNEQDLVAGTVVEIPIQSTQFKELLGFQFALNFDPAALEFIELLPNEAIQLSVNNFGLDFIEKGLITTSWEQAILQERQNTKEELFTLKFKVKENTSLSEVLSINHQFMKAEAYATVEDGQLDLLDVGLTFNDLATMPSSFDLYQNRPNPFNGNTVIGFELSQAENISMTILDVTGRVRKTVQQAGQVGYNELVIKSKELAGKGVYYYQLATSEGIKTRKMLIVE